MASTLASALAQVEGPELDLRVGYVVPRPVPNEVDAEVRAAFAKVGQPRLDGLVRMLSSRRRSDFESASDALQEAFLHLLETRNELFRTDPDDWWNLLYKTAEYRLLRLKSQRGALSIERLLDEQGDTVFRNAKPCISESDALRPDIKDIRLPQGDEKWTRELIIGAFQGFKDRTGRQPKSDECRRINLLPSFRTVYSHFDSFADALLASGMVPGQAKTRRHRWTPVEAAKKCLNFRHREGRWPDWADARAKRWDVPGYSTMIRYFGGARAIDVQLGTEAILDGYEET